MKTETGNDQNLVISYLTLRKAIGFLGVSLPFTVSLGALLFFRTGLQIAVSNYYYTGTRDVFVGSLWAIGFFFLSYKGYERIDRIAGILGCIFALGVALFPTAPEIDPSPTARIIGYFHMGFAGLFFFTLIFFSLFLFTRTTPQLRPTRRKLQRNLVYRLCGYSMLGCILLMTIHTFLPAGVVASLAPLRPLFWLETIAILSFGVSWLTKGQAILQDEPVQG